METIALFIALVVNVVLGKWAAEAFIRNSTMSIYRPMVEWAVDTRSLAAFLMCLLVAVLVVMGIINKFVRWYLECVKEDNTKGEIPEES